jgi:hypothetical protein
MAAVTNEHVLDVDSRGRVSLGRLAQPGHRRYLAHVEADGTIVLTPAVVVSALEAEILADPELVAKIRAGLADGGVEVERPTGPSAATDDA